MSELYVIAEALFYLLVHTTLLLCLAAFWVGVFCGAGWLMLRTVELLFYRRKS